MITLGTFDENVTSGALDAYKHLVKTTMIGTDPLPEWHNQLREEGKWVNYSKLSADEGITVAKLQEFLHNAGFLASEKFDGICGYRTAGAIFLFQEYVRTIEKIDIGFPDGKFGKVSLSHVQRWGQQNLKADWTKFSATNPSEEYTKWMTLLQAAHTHYRENPTATMAKISTAGNSDSLKVAEWDFAPDKIHLLGLRHHRTPSDKQTLDDLYLLLIRGVVFTFYGSTEPGVKVAAEYPFLIPGQHRYRFGVHQMSETKKVFKALCPATNGVRVQRSAKLFPTEAELTLDPRPNTTIHIHWGGEGLSDSAGWSAGCQVIAGKSYINHHGDVINCAPFAATNYADLGTTVNKTFLSKGAYTVLEDLVAAFSGAKPDDYIVHYTLLDEADVALHPDIKLDELRDKLKRLKA